MRGDARKERPSLRSGEEKEKRRGRERLVLRRHGRLDLVAGGGLLQSQELCAGGKRKRGVSVGVIGGL